MEGAIGRFRREEIEEIINEYGGSLTIPPESAYESLYVGQIRDTNEYLVQFDLWFDNEESDLTLMCETIVEENGQIKIWIDDIHVM